MADLEAQRAIEKEEEAKKKDGNMKSQEISIKQLKQLLTQKNCTKKDLQRAQSKIKIGLKRTAELEEDH